MGRAQWVSEVDINTMFCAISQTDVVRVLLSPQIFPGFSYFLPVK